MVQTLSLEVKSAAPLRDTMEAPLEGAVRAQLDGYLARLSNGDVFAEMNSLIGYLTDLRRRLHRDDWRTLAAEVINQHPLTYVVRKCPLTGHCAAKPRGYAGDAELIDHIYGVGVASQAPHPATLAGKIYSWNVNTPGCRAARRRRELIAAEIDKAATSGEGQASILSVACGHLREADLALSLRSGAIRRFVALDQDQESLLEVSRSYGHLGIETQQGTVRSIIARKTSFANMDFVYAAGLYDYLVAPIGARLAARMFEFLRPGGRLLVANFVPTLPGVGYMETFMDWWLIYRTGEEMRAIFDELPASQVAEIDVFEDELGAIAYATVEKRN